MPAYPSAAPTEDRDLVSVDAIVESEIAALLRAAIAGRLLILPLVVAVAVLVAVMDGTPWRTAALFTTAAVMLVGALIVEWRARRTGVTLGAAGPNAIAMALGQLVIIACTGGVDSPLLPIMLPLGLLATIAMGRRPATAALIAIQTTVLAALTVTQALGVARWLDMPVLYNNSAPPPPGTRLATGFVLVLVLTAASVFGLILRRRFESMIRTGVHARAAQLQTWQTWSKDLEALSGELAHELKNPLTSIKGLTALVQRDGGDGRSKERIEVLASEVERMQGIVEDFLTFSRPLTPLSMQPVSLLALCQQVEHLHEGQAVGGNVRLLCTGDAPQVLADPRKLLQVLVNLVQNALHVAPRGSDVELHVGTDTNGVFVDVCDRGPGVSGAVRERAFVAGVTSREDGSGLGLPIALAITRQHGGDLVLLDRADGGTLARLTLPRSAP